MNILVSRLRQFQADTTGHMLHRAAFQQAADEIERLRETLSEIEDFARGEGDVGNIVARKAAAALRPETAPPAHQLSGDDHG